MNKKARQYIGLLSALISYYLVHEGAHLVYALYLGAFKQINFMGLGVQIEVVDTAMTNTQLGIFCLLGAAATLVAAYALVLLCGKICKAQNKVFKAAMYYITLVMLLLDPVYLSVLCGFFGGGDMNGIALLVPEAAARIGFGVLLAVNALVFWKVVLPQFTKSFQE